MAELSSILKQATGVVAARGEGVHLFDEDDRRYLDFTAGIGVTSTGHCHPRVVAAAREQVGTLIHGQYTTVMHPPLRRLVEKLGEVLPAGLDSLFPSLDADIELGELGPERTQLSMSARYTPPLGPVGRFLDRALLHRVAEATVKDFLDRAAQMLSAVPAGSSEK